MSSFMTENIQPDKRCVNKNRSANWDPWEENAISEVDIGRANWKTFFRIKSYFLQFVFENITFTLSISSNRY